MTQALLKSRLLASAQSAQEQLQPDFEAQYTEFVSIAQSILYSDIGYLAITQSLDEALGLLEESLASKKRTLPEAAPPQGSPQAHPLHPPVQLQEKQAIPSRGKTSSGILRQFILNNKFAIQKLRIT